MFLALLSVVPRRPVERNDIPPNTSRRRGRPSGCLVSGSCDLCTMTGSFICIAFFIALAWKHNASLVLEDGAGLMPTMRVPVGSMHVTTQYVPVSSVSPS